MGKALKFSQIQRENIMLFLIVLLSFFRYSYFGLFYTPYLDDYIQYSYYPSFKNPWENILLGGAGVLSTRPLAGLCDFFLWSKFYQNLGIVVAVISVLYGMSGVFFYKALKNFGIKVGAVFFAVYLFLPLNSEGTYWVSASSRIAVSLFLISLSVWAVSEDRLLLFSLFSFFSVWFYEQTAVLSFFMGILAGIFKKSPKILGTVTIIFLSLLVFYFKFGTFGENADRLKMIKSANLFGGVASVLVAFADILGRINFKIIFNGFLRGFKIIALDFSIVWIGLLTVFCILFVNASHGKNEEQKRSKKQLLLGAALMVVPLMPFFIIENSVINLRNAVPCLIGLGLMADSAVDWIFKKYTSIVAGILIFCFSVSAVSEVNDYNYVARQDAKTAKEIVKTVNPDTKRIKVKVKSPKYYPQNAPYNDHIMSITQSDWGPSGIVRTISKNREVVVEVVRE